MSGFNIKKKKRDFNKEWFVYCSEFSKFCPSYAKKNKITIVLSKYLKFYN